MRNICLEVEKNSSKLSKLFQRTTFHNSSNCRDKRSPTKCYKIKNKPKLLTAVLIGKINQPNFLFVFSVKFLLSFSIYFIFSTKIFGYLTDWTGIWFFRSHERPMPPSIMALLMASLEPLGIILPWCLRAYMRTLLGPHDIEKSRSLDSC